LYSYSCSKVLALSLYKGKVTKKALAFFSGLLRDMYFGKYTPPPARGGHWLMSSAGEKYEKRGKYH
jgi:hypothetical protein